MRYRATGLRISLGFSVILFGICGSGARGQNQQAPALPANWQQLSPADFATLVQQYIEQGTFKSLGIVDRESLASQGATLFSQINIATTSLSYQTLNTLEHVGQLNLDQWARARAKTALLARRDDWVGKPFSEVLAKVQLMARLRIPDPILLSQARQWVQAGGTPAQVPQNDLVYDFVRQMFADVNIIDGSFSVNWAGQINAPQTGDYTFSISPIDVNVGFTSPPAELSVTVYLSGQAIISAAPPTTSTLQDPLARTYQPSETVKPNWLVQSNPVSLTAGTPVNISVVVSVDAPQSLPSGLFHAMLFWQGPGITKSLVPASAFSQAQTGSPGLKATYTWTMKGQQQTLTRTDSMIDFAWTASPILLPQDPTSANQLANTLWQNMTSTSFLASYANQTPPLKLHPFLREPDEVSCGLTTARRRSFLDLLLQNPTLLDAMDARHAVSFFESFRVGTPDKALDVFGTWTTRKADLPCELSFFRSFDADTQLALARMAILTTQQLPAQAARLQQEFLQLPDGGCSLPVAYTLTYSYVGRGKLTDWIATLNAKLADATVTGDLRVNWLIARAQAQEFTLRAPLHYPFGIAYPSTWPLEGMSYLYQAFNAAQSPWVKVRAAKEIASRRASSGQYQAAIDFLSQVATSLPAPQKSVVTGWQQQIAAFVAAQPAALQAQRSESKRAYLMTLKARRDRAANQGNSAAVSRYDALINAVSNRQ